MGVRLTDLPEMVARVTDAISNSIFSKVSRRECEDAARAAIQMMREPTQAMWDAGARAAEQLEPNAWESMIDAALGENEDEKSSCN